MKIDSSVGATLPTMAGAAAAAEASGYDGIWVGETSHDAFLRLLMAASSTAGVDLGTSVAIAFARNPMTMAMAARDLNDYAGGRLLLGLGSQIKTHIENRYSMPWSQPAARMREYILAMRAIWASWQTGEKLDFRGDFYSHTLMTPLFSPGPSEYGEPRVLLAAVGERMTQVAAEAADGLLVHPFSTPRYIEEVTLPALRAGLAAADRNDVPFDVVVPAFVVCADTEEELATATAACRKQLAFYASTPSYRGVFELHGWDDRSAELTRLSKQGAWDAMAELVSDEILQAFAVVGDPATVATELRKRYTGLADRLSFFTPYPIDRTVLLDVLSHLREDAR